MSTEATVLGVFDANWTIADGALGVGGNLATANAVEVALPNKDSCFVLAGQGGAEIKVEAFPFTRYGAISGEVLYVSGSAVQGPNSDPTQRRRANNAGGIAEQGGEQVSPVYSVRTYPGRWARHGVDAEYGGDDGDQDGAEESDSVSA